MKAILKIEIITILLLGAASSQAQSPIPTSATISPVTIAPSTVGAVDSAWKQKWEQMTSAQKEAFLQTHPKVRERALQQREEALQRSRDKKPTI